VIQILRHSLRISLGSNRKVLVALLSLGLPPV